MNNYSVKLLIVITLAVPAVVLAQIGQTRQQWEAKFGKPTRYSAELGVVFEKDGLQRTVYFDAKNKAEWIHYEPSEPFKPEEAAAILKSNTSESWEPEPGSKDGYLSPRAGLKGVLGSSIVTVLTDDLSRQFKQLRLGRVGQSREECEKKAGPPTKTLADGGIVFQKNGIEMTGYFDPADRLVAAEYRGCDFKLSVLYVLLPRQDWKVLDEYNFKSDDGTLSATISNAVLRVYFDDWKTSTRAAQKTKIAPAQPAAAEIMIGIGKTREALERSYGKPSQVLTNGAVEYQKKDFIITFEFNSEQQVDSINYYCTRKLTGSEAGNLLKAQADADEKWDIHDNLGGFDAHATVAKLTAYISERSVLVQTDAREQRRSAASMQEWDEQRKRAKEQEIKKNFTRQSEYEKEELKRKAEEKKGINGM